jgi:hypothetical protein
MKIFDAISLKIIGRCEKDGETVVSEFIVEKDTSSEKYHITRFKHETIGKNDSGEYRDFKIETHTNNMKFTTELKKLIEDHFILENI